MQDKPLHEKVHALVKAGRVELSRPNSVGRALIGMRFLDTQRGHIWNWFHVAADGTWTFTFSHSSKYRTTRGLRRQLCVEEMIHHAYARFCVPSKFADQ